jgi:hypothetical protein
VLDAVGVLCGTESKEGVNCREAHVAGGGDVAALDLEVMKEIEQSCGPRFSTSKSATERRRRSAMKRSSNTNVSR